MIGWEEAPKWLETDWLLACFGKQRKKAIGKYVDFVWAGAGLPPVWENLRRQMFLTGDDFVSRLRSKLNDAGKEDLSEVPKMQRKAVSKPLE